MEHLEQAVEALDIELLEHSRMVLQATPTDNPQAYDYYLRAIDYEESGWASDDYQDFHQATQMLEKAVALDPDFALAFVRLSAIHSWIY